MTLSNDEEILTKVRDQLLEDIDTIIKTNNINPESLSKALDDANNSLPDHLSSQYEIVVGLLEEKRQVVAGWRELNVE